MAKEKLFTPEDFDKPKDKSFWQKYKVWIIISITAILIIAAIVLCCVFCGKTEEKIETDELAKSEQTVTSAETQERTEISKTVETATAPETQEVEQIEEQRTPAPDVKAPKEEMKPEVSQPANVSDNIEQEAMNVIRGHYGNVPERCEKLGSKYQEIQDRVNQLKKEGVF